MAPISASRAGRASTLSVRYGCVRTRSKIGVVTEDPQHPRELCLAELGTQVVMSGGDDLPAGDVVQVAEELRGSGTEQVDQGGVELGPPSDEADSAASS